MPESDRTEGPLEHSPRSYVLRIIFHVPSSDVFRVLSGRESDRGRESGAC